MSTLRFKVVEEAFKKRPVPVAAPAERPSEYYGKYVFTQEKMRKYLPLRTYQQYVHSPRHPYRKCDSTRHETMGY